MTRTTRWLVVALLVSVPGAVRGQEAQAPADIMSLSLEQLGRLEVDQVYGASKVLQEVSAAPASITVIKAREIQEFGYRTLADILRNVRGLYVTYDRNYQYVGVRGFNRPGDYNSRVLLLVDGHRINDSVYDGALFGTEFPLDVALIDRVEVIRGPSSSLYGTSAFLTVVSVITKEAAEAAGVQVEATAGTLGTQKGRVTFGRRTDGGIGVLLSASAYRSDQETQLYFPEFDAPETNNGYAIDLDADAARQLFGSVSVGGLTVRGVYGWREKYVPTASYGTIFNDPENFTVDTRGYVDALYGRSIVGGTRLLARAYVDRSGYEGAYPYEEGDQRLIERDFSLGWWWGSELTLSNTSVRGHTLTGGLEYRNNPVQDQSATLEATGEPGALEDVLRDERTSSSWAAYAQDEWRIVSPLALTLGVRHDHYSTFGGSTNGRLALVYTPARRTSLKILRGTAFRAPSTFELYYNIVGVNPDLLPEEITTTEAVWEQYLGARVRTAVTGFQYTIDNLISAVEGSEYLGATFQNAGTVTARGAEFEMETTLSDAFTARFAQTVQRAEDDATGEWLTNSPRTLTYVGVRWRPVRDVLTLAYSGQHTGDRRTIAGALAPSYFRQDVTVTTRAGRPLALTAGVSNLANARYYDPGGPDHVQEAIGQPCRTFWVSASYRF